MSENKEECLAKVGEVYSVAYRKSQDWYTEDGTIVIFSIEEDIVTYHYFGRDYSKEGGFVRDIDGINHSILEGHIFLHPYHNTKLGRHLLELEGVKIS